MPSRTTANSEIAKEFGFSQTFIMHKSTYVAVNVTQSENRKYRNNLTGNDKSDKK